LRRFRLRKARVCAARALPSSDAPSHQDVSIHSSILRQDRQRHLRLAARAFGVDLILEYLLWLKLNYVSIK
jgi:hypothetical protein